MPIPSNLVAPAAGGTPVVLDHSHPSRSPVDAPLQVEPNYPWFFICYPMDPGAWTVATIEAEGPDDAYAGTWWLPRLQTLPVKPGVCGHRTKRKGQDLRVSYGTAHERIRLQDGIVLPHSLGYQTERECVGPMSRNTGTYFLDVWSTPRAKLPRKRQKFDFDRQRFYRWLLQLLWDGVIPSPGRDVVDHQLAKVADRLARRVAQDFKGDDAAKELALAEAEARQAEALDARVATENPRSAPRAKRDPTDPDQMTYAELRSAAAQLGWTGNRKKFELLDIVRAGEPPPSED